MPLTDAQRASLDERVDADALERFLEHFPVEYHAAIINGCLRIPDPDLDTAVEFIDPAIQDEWDALWERWDSE